MSPKQLLYNIQNMLWNVSNNKHALEKIHKFLKNEIIDANCKVCDMEIEESNIISEKHKEVVSKIAESIDSGFICHINNDTLQYVEEQNNEYDALDTEELDEFAASPNQWKNYITIDPMSSNELFSIMEAFVEIIPDKKFKEKLQEKLHKHKSYDNFIETIESSPFRKQWKDFKHKQIMEYVYNVLWENNLVEDDENN